MRRHLAPEELRALAAHALVGAAHSFSQASTADYRAKLGLLQVRGRGASRPAWGLAAALAALPRPYQASHLLEGHVRMLAPPVSLPAAPHTLPRLPAGCRWWLPGTPTWSACWSRAW